MITALYSLNSLAFTPDYDNYRSTQLTAEPERAAALLACFRSNSSPLVNSHLAFVRRYHGDGRRGPIL